MSIAEPVNDRRLIDVVLRNPALAAVLDAMPGLGLPNGHLAAGAIAQTVWNSALGRDLNTGIRDVDLIYFDTNLSESRELENREKVRELFPDIDIPIDIKNEARVHLWYRRKFGYKISPYRSVQEAIASFPTTATSVGISKQGSEYSICAPFGLGDLLGLVVRPNARQITREIYEAKVARWRRSWPELTFLSWDEAER
jgi:hypothetical protein